LTEDKLVIFLEEGEYDCRAGLIEVGKESERYLLGYRIAEMGTLDC
jgi:hypothetical protein